MAPLRRIILWPRGGNWLEIVLLGAPHDVAPMWIAIRAHVESWYGFETPTPLVQDRDQVGIAVHLSKLASHTDPVAEALRCLANIFGLEWSMSNKLGAVGTW